MKLENLVFQKRSNKGGNYNVNYSYPNVRCSAMSGGHGSRRVVFRFRACDTLYESNNYCVYAVAGNRLYFMFCGESDMAYKLVTYYRNKKTNKAPRMLCIAYNKEISKFVRNEEYTPKLDNECGLWYIEY